MASTLVQASVPADSVKKGFLIIPPKTKKVPAGGKQAIPLEMPKKPELPKKIEMPQIPNIPEMPKQINMPEMPKKPEIPDIPKIPGMKQAPPGELPPPNAGAPQGGEQPPPASDQGMIPPPGGGQEQAPGKKKEEAKDEMPPPDPFMTEPKTLETPTPKKESAQKKSKAQKRTPATPAAQKAFRKVLGVKTTATSVNIEIENAGKKEELVLALKESVLASLGSDKLQEEMTVTVDFVEEEENEVARVITIVRS